jgi:hypothetical protein
MTIIIIIVIITMEADEDDDTDLTFFSSMQASASPISVRTCNINENFIAPFIRALLSILHIQSVLIWVI